MADILLEVTDLHKEFEDTVAVSGISFRIYKGESVGIVGESGCGKSTTARVVSGLEKPTAGKVLFQGKPYVLRPGKGRCAINMVFQDPIDSFDSRMTVFASLYEALSHTKKISRQDAVPVIENALQTVNSLFPIRTEEFPSSVAASASELALPEQFLPNPSY